MSGLFTSELEGKITKENKSRATTRSPLSFEIKNGTDCVSGVRKLRAGLEPKTKHCNAQVVQLERHELHLCLASSLAQEQQEGNIIY